MIPPHGFGRLSPPFTEARYEPNVGGLQQKQSLNTLFQEMQPISPANFRSREKERKIMAKLIRKTVDIVFLALLAVIVFAAAVSLAETAFHGALAYIVGAGILAVMLFAVIWGRSRLQNIGRRIEHHLEPVPAWKLALFLGLFSAVTKIFLVFLFDNNADLHPDMAMYRSYAEQYAATGKITEGAGYAYQHSYMAFYGLILSPFAKLFGADTKVFTVLLSVLHSVAMVLLFDTLRHYIKKELAFFVLMLYCILPVGLLQTQLLVHENALFFFHILAIWLFERAFRKKTHWLAGIFLVFAAAIVLAMGKSVNAAGRVFFISFGIYAVAKTFSAKITIKKCASLVCVIAILVGCYVGSTSMLRSLKENTLVVDRENQSISYSYPYGWSLYVGLNYDSAGGWTEEDAAIYSYYETFGNKEDAIQYQKGLLEQRTQMYKENPLKIPVHLFNKIKHLWGEQILPFAYEQGNSINDFILHGMGGMINKACSLTIKISSLLIYLIILLGQWRKLKYGEEEINPDLHFRMAIIGVTLALLLFEVTPKYVSHLHIGFYGILALNLKYYFVSKIQQV